MPTTAPNQRRLRTIWVHPMFLALLASGPLLAGCSSSDDALTPPNDTPRPIVTDDVRPIASEVERCGLSLVAPSMRTYCGVLGSTTGDSEGVAFEHPDDPFTNFLVDITNDVGQRLHVGALIIGDTRIAYFLAEPLDEGDVRIVDLIDSPADADDFRIDGNVFALVDANADTIAVYQVVSRNFVAE